MHSHKCHWCFNDGGGGDDGGKFGDGDDSDDDDDDDDSNINTYFYMKVLRTNTLLITGLKNSARTLMIRKGTHFLIIWATVSSLRRRVSDAVCYSSKRRANSYSPGISYSDKFIVHSVFRFERITGGARSVSA